MAQPAIQTDKLTKYYGKQRGIEDVSLSVEAGQVFGFLGPNGAGKTTTIRLLLDLIRPSSGNATVLGLDVTKESLAVRRRVGYLPGDLHLHEHLTGRQQCQYFSNIRKLDCSPEIGNLAARLDLDLDRKIEDYSTGNRQKVGIVQAFMHKPSLLILDEPTAGLDPLVRQRFYAMLNDVAEEGRTVLLSSHILPEVEQVADRVAIIRDGVIVEVEGVAALKLRAVRRLVLQFVAPVDIGKFERLKAVKHVSSINDGRSVVLLVEGSLDLVVKEAARHEVQNIVSHDGDLEDVFLEYYRSDDGAAKKADVDEQVIAEKGSR